MEDLGLADGQISVGLVVFGSAELGAKLVFLVLGDRLPCLKVHVIAVSSLFAAAVAGFMAVGTTYQQVVCLSTGE